MYSPFGDGALFGQIAAQSLTPERERQQQHQHVPSSFSMQMDDQQATGGPAETTTAFRGTAPANPDSPWNTKTMRQFLSQGYGRFLDRVLSASSVAHPKSAVVCHELCKMRKRDI
jgi:hypothetical protein